MGIILRPYQSECVERIFADFEAYRSVLAVLSTGLGKTVLGAEVIRRWIGKERGRVLWIAHREELIQQAAQTIRDLTGLAVSVEMGDSYADEFGFQPADVVVASVQTLIRPRRRRRFKPDRFGLAIVDECHHVVSKSYRSIIKYFRQGDESLGIAGNPEVRLLGVTATPKRSDDLAMGKVFEHVSYEYGILKAVHDGYLVPVRQATAIVEDLDLSKVKVVNGDFAPGQLEAALTDPNTRIVYKMVQPIIENAGSSPTIVFCAGKHQARLMANAINDSRPGSAFCVTDDTPKDERRDLIARFKSGALQFATNVGVMTEGFDHVAVGLVAIARPTKSLTLYTQQLGRATRPLKGVVDGIDTAEGRRLAIARSSKPWATVLDFVGNVERHGDNATINAADILGGKYSDEVKQYAKKAMSEQDGSRPVEEALERAEAELALIAEEGERKARIIAEVDYRVRYHDGGRSGPRREQEAGRRGEPATDKQVWKLCTLGIPRHKAERCTKAQATGWIGKLLAERGIAT